MHGVSFKKTPREGQARVIEEVLDSKSGKLNIQLPTGYGKTYTAAGSYSVLFHRGDVNRLLYIVPTSAQLEQFVQDGRTDFDDAGVDVGPVVDIGWSSVTAIRKHRSNKSMVYATTIQALAAKKSTWEIVIELMKTGKWMLVVDEYHHYGVDAVWGVEIKKFSFIFTLAMSATPERPGDDSAFGKPDVVVSYREAVKENAVKPLRCHSYVYRIDAVTQNGEIQTYTTNELVEEVGSQSPEAIEKFRIERQMRWSPKYVSPLVDAPLARLIRQRLATHYPLQALVGAMCCSHAELVYEQLKASYPEFNIDWCGTGTSGRSDAENRIAIEGFCPKKVDGVRRIEDIKVDVLVHVGMAGEGLDSVYVSEVIHLNPANINNSNNQENGRAARYLRSVTGYVNVDSTSPYSEFSGERVMDVMDDPGALADESNEDPKDVKDDDDWEPMPEEMKIKIWDLECIEIDEGEVEKMKKAYAEVGSYDLSDPNCVLHEKAKDLYRKMRNEELEQINDKSSIAQADDKVEQALRHVTNLVIRLKIGKGQRREKSMAGDIKRQINTRKRRVMGAKEKDVEVLKKHYEWLRDLELDLLDAGIPEWLI